MCFSNQEAQLNQAQFNSLFTHVKGRTNLTSIPNKKKRFSTGHNTRETVSLSRIQSPTKRTLLSQQF